MADGEGCKCAAHSESECGCNADWTPQELIDARAEIERLRLTDEEREAIEWAEVAAIVDAENETDADDAVAYESRAATLRALRERLH
jgi:hypothetical protein